MALQWAILASIVVVEATIAIILTLPWPRLLKSRVVALAYVLLKLSAGVLPFVIFQLMDLYWKKEHLLICASEVCTAGERDRYEKSALKKTHRKTLLKKSPTSFEFVITNNIPCLVFFFKLAECSAGSLQIPWPVGVIYKAQRNVVLCILAFLLYWCIYSICKYQKHVQELEEDERWRKTM